jgi:hypothetical protein
MKTITRSILVSLLLIVAAPAYSDSTHAVHIFRCEFIDQKVTEDEVLKLAAEWLKAAKQMKGGANMELIIRFPVAVGVGEVGDFTWAAATPTFAEWGEFTDAYEGSEVSRLDDQLFGNLVDCGHSSIWEGIVME